MINALLSLYLPQYPSVLVYMLQNTEYQVGPYLKWYWRTQNFSKVMYRRTLVHTKAARLLLWALRIGMLLQIAVGLLLIALWYLDGLIGGLAFGFAAIVAYPVMWAHLAVLPLLAGRLVIVNPRNRKRVVASEATFAKHGAERIAVVGSYGKTSMKELLLTVLGEAKKVAATPANKNVAISHAAFARSLSGDEEVLIIEYGEGQPGDVAKFARITHPTRAVITGVAAAHLDHYASTEAAGKDIFTVADYIGDKAHVYVNAESQAAKQFITSNFSSYDQAGALGWKAEKVQVSIDGLSFTLAKDGTTLRLKSSLLGRHNIGPLSLVAALACELGMSVVQVEAAVAKTQPFEHRMQPYRLGGAWVIDDTYNGNIEGIRAGTALLKELPAKRKLYATPGLVDQGKESQAIHEEMGRLVAASGADVVVLMKNSVTTHIEAGLRAGDYKGELQIETDPLSFYNNLGQFVAAGDLILLQNDWPDNYA